MQWPQATQEFFVSILMEAVFNALKGMKLPGAQPMPSLQTESLQDFCFPPLYAEDTYADMGCRLSPPELLNVAAPLWMAVTRSLADTKRELQRLGGQAHLQVALNTPVVYKSSSKRGKLLCGNVLMFVLDSLSQRQSGGSRGEQRDVVSSLLEHRADAESSYGMNEGQPRRVSGVELSKGPGRHTVAGPLLTKLKLLVAPFFLNRSLLCYYGSLK